MEVGELDDHVRNSDLRIATHGVEERTNCMKCPDCNEELLDFSKNARTLKAGEYKLGGIVETSPLPTDHKFLGCPRCGQVFSTTNVIE